MAKAINWPAHFRQEVIDEPAGELKTAFRLGRIYFDNQYWVDGEEVDIRVNHKVIRKAIIQGELKCCRIDQLDARDYQLQKSNLNDMHAVIDFLAKTYNQPVTPDTEITVVYYTNRPLDPEIMDADDDPHAVVEDS